MNLRIGVVYGLAMVLLPGMGLLSPTAVAAEAEAEFVPVEKQRVIVLTDISNEPDDEESLARFLVYSNEYDVEGLIATTSVWLKDTVRPERIQERVALHVILEVWDDGQPRLCSYRRIIVTVGGA